MKLKQLRTICNLSVADVARIVNLGEGYAYRFDRKDLFELRTIHLRELSRYTGLSIDAMVSMPYRKLKELYQKVWAIPNYTKDELIDKIKEFDDLRRFSVFEIYGDFATGNVTDESRIDLYLESDHDDLHGFQLVRFQRHLEELLKRPIRSLDKHERVGECLKLK